MFENGPLVTADWVADNLERIALVDVRWSIETGPKLDQYLAGHLPGAVFADLDADLSDPPGERGRHPLPSPERFAEARSRLGIGSKPVVAYDDHGGSQAARLWWMLDAIGHPAAVLDGGMQTWGRELESGPVTVAADPTPVVPWPADRFVEVDGVLPAIAEGAVVMDARSAERFAGKPNPIDARPGHIPGSVSRPWTDNLAEDGRLLPADRLADELQALGVTAGGGFVASCGSGVTGCHDLLAARVAGFAGGRLYTGSWSEWSQDPSRPVDRFED
jgi:thiosulfate/3-mercaptopyruvate sulfurtransferase